jgi:RNA polymerase sigma factor (sigma-70 family)
MAEHPLGEAARQLLRSLAPQSSDSDAQLLTRFAQLGDEEAFEVLLERHGPMVWRTCRRVARQAADVEDAFQATFLVLCRKVGSIGKRASLGGWLHRVAYRIALKANSRSAFRRLDEEQLPARDSDPAAALMESELRPLLDEALNRLPEKYRIPLVLCCLEGKTRARAAAELGWAEGTLSSRLAQGKELLRAHLLRRGAAPSAGALAALLAQEGAVRALPRALLRATLKMKSLFLLGQAAGSGGPALHAVVLAEGALKTMFLTKLKVVAVVLLAAGLLGVGAGKVTQQVLAAKPAANAHPALAKNEQPPVKVDPLPVAPAEQAMARTLGVVVLDPQGKPVSGANIHASIWTDEKGFKANHDYPTDAAGAAQVELPKTFTILRLWAWAGKKPFVSMFANWEQNVLASGREFPAEYTFRLESAVAAGGRILDEQGKPIAGAKVQVMLGDDDDLKFSRRDDRALYNTWLAEGREAATTDAEGRWRIDNVPDHPQAELRLLVSHPDYVSDEEWGQTQKIAGITTAMLRQEKARLTLKAGVIVRGRVTDPGGKPIKDALVVHGDNPYNAWMPTKFPTDADGQFRLPALAPRETTLTVIAPNWAPQLRKVNLQPGMPPQDFRMEPGKPIRLRIIDAAGKPVPNAYVSLVEWKGSQSIQSSHNTNHPKVPDTKIPRQTNTSGIWEWTSAPDEPVKLQIYLKGFAACELEIPGGAAERMVTLKAKHRVTGRVTDALTGRPIPAFTVVPIDVFRKDFLVADRGHAVAGKNGRLDYLVTRTDIPLRRLRVEAWGYRTQDGPQFQVGDDVAFTQDFRLQPSPPVTGVVHDVAGQPVAQAEVLLATPTAAAKLSSDWGNHKAFTDAAGCFAFPDPGEPWAVLAQADAGFALAEFPAGQHDAGALRLRPWASVRGQFRDGGQPVRGATILLQPVRLDSLDRPKIDAMIQTVTGADGRFEFPRVPSVPVSVRVHLGPWKDEGFRSGPSVPLDLQPGQRAELDLGGAGTIVTGKVTLTGKVPVDLDCTYSLNCLVRRAPGIAPPQPIASLGFDVRNGWRDTWRKSSEGLTYLSTLRYWFVKLAPDGAFRISGVPPGEYDLAVEVYAKPSGCLVDPLARKLVRVTVTAADAARGELALPEIAAAVVPVPAVGDTPALTFQGADGTSGTLTDYRGRYTVVHFWASWCGPCKQQLPGLRRLHERYTARGLATLGLALDEDPAAWQAALKQLDLPWQQGRLAAASTAGVSSVPAYWLLDPAGKIVDKVYDSDELAAALADRLK